MACSLRSADGKARRFLPFMEGPRSCAGQALAVMNLTATLAMLYGSFTFRLADEVRSTYARGCGSQSGPPLAHWYCQNDPCRLLSGQLLDAPVDMGSVIAAVACLG